MSIDRETSYKETKTKLQLETVAKIPINKIQEIKGHRKAGLIKRKNN